MKEKSKEKSRLYVDAVNYKGRWMYCYVYEYYDEEGRKRLKAKFNELKDYNAFTLMHVKLKALANLRKENINYDVIRIDNDFIYLLLKGKENAKDAYINAIVNSLDDDIKNKIEHITKATNKARNAFVKFKKHKINVGEWVDIYGI